MTDSPFIGFFRRSSGRRLAGIVCLLGLLLLGVGKQSAEAQRLRVDVGGGWAFPTNNVELAPSNEFEANVTEFDARGDTIGTRTEPVAVPQPVDLKSGRHVYAGIGFVRSISDQFALGFRLRGHTSELESSVNCRFKSTCNDPSGRIWTATVEGRIILTSPDWIDPYLLVGIGVVHTSVDGLTLRNVEQEATGRLSVNPTTEQIPYSEVSITDAGGDVGIGASIPLTGGLAVDGEVRASGSLPGGKENTTTTVPFTLGLSYTFQ